MAYINDNELLNFERVRAKLETLLRNKGVNVLPNEDINSLIDKVNKIGNNAYFEGYLTDTIDVIDDDKAEGVLKSYTFYNRGTLRELTLENITRTETYAVYNCSILEKLHLPNLLQCNGNNSLRNLPQCHDINLDSLEVITGNDGFSGIGSSYLGVYGLYLPSLNSTYNNSFGVGNCTYFSAPKYTSAGANCLPNNSTKIKIADIGLVNITQNMKNPNMEILILRKSTMPTLSNTSIFNTSPFATSGAGGVIYAPESYYQNLLTATNWSALNFTVKKLEGSQFEPTDWLKTLKEANYDESIWDEYNE